MYDELGTLGDGDSVYTFTGSDGVNIGRLEFLDDNFTLFTTLKRQFVDINRFFLASSAVDEAIRFGVTNAGVPFIREAAVSYSFNDLLVPLFDGCSIAFRRQNDSFTCYLDQTKSGTTHTITGIVEDPLTDKKLGQYADFANGWSGTVGYPVIVSRAMTDNEILDYNRQRLSISTGLEVTSITENAYRVSSPIVWD